VGARLKLAQRVYAGNMIVIVIGVAGSGKTTVGRMLAADLEWDFLDADDLHPPANREKMARGVPLTDADRAPWLERLAQQLQDRVRKGRRSVVACSALKESYRERLRVDPSVRFVYLRGDTELFRERLRTRRGHYFGAELLASQLETLEEPAEGLTLDASESPATLAERIRDGLRLTREPA
jgi:gluconokinase